MLDGRKGGAAQSNLIGAFCDDNGKAIDNIIHITHIISEESTLAKRRGRVCGCTTLDFN